MIKIKYFPIILILGILILFTIPTTSSVTFNHIGIDDEYQVQGNIDNLNLNLDELKIDINNLQTIEDDIIVNITLNHEYSEKTIEETYTYSAKKDGSIEDSILINLVDDNKFDGTNFTEYDKTELSLDISVDHTDVQKQEFRKDIDIEYISKIQSCQDILNENPDANTGIYEIESESGNEIEVYCDMDTNGGGWTLVASTTGTDDTSQFHYEGGDWTGGDDGNIRYDLRSNNYNQYIHSEPIGNIDNRTNQDTVLPSYYEVSFDEMMFTDDVDNYISYDGMSGSNVSMWFENLDSTVDTETEENLVGSCSNNHCENTIDDSFEPSSTNIDTSVNNQNRLTIRFKSEDGDNSLGSNNNHWKYGPTWDWERNNNVNWDEGGFGWASAAETDGGDYISTRGLGGTQADHNAEYIFWYIK